MHRLQINSLPLPVPDYDDPKDLYAFCGLAVYYAQLIEHRLIYLAAVVRQTGRGLMTQQECSGICASLNRKTLTQILNAVCCLAAIPENFKVMLGNVLEKQHYLSEWFFRVHVEDSWSETGRRNMIEELQEMITLFKRADQQIEHLSLTLQNSFSVDEACIEKELKTLLPGKEQDRCSGCNGPEVGNGWPPSI